MSRPRIICHMHTLLNGKIDGIANITSVGMRAQREYFDLFLRERCAFTGHRGWLSGRATSEAIMGGPRDVSFPEPAAPVPEGDYIADPDAQMFDFAVDGSGKLAWDEKVDGPIADDRAGILSEGFSAQRSAQRRSRNPRSSSKASRITV